MQYIFLATGSSLADVLIEIILLPFFEHGRFALRKIGTHGEVSFRQI